MVEKQKVEGMKKEELLAKIKRNITTQYEMPSIDDIHPITYADPLKQFMEVTQVVGGKVMLLKEGDQTDINSIVKKLHPDAKQIASELPEVTIATINPNTVKEANELNGTDVAVLKGVFGVAENGCVWIPQTMKEKAVCFISEQLVIILNRKDIVNNMHEAYSRIELNDYGYGCFISGPSKTADIAQALVMGAQAARGVTVVII